MQIPDEARKCVAFIEVKRNSGFEARGTAFFVSVNVSNSLRANYVVTAAHCIEESTKLSNDPENVWLRVNDRQRSVRRISVPMGEWMRHPFELSDVAVAPLNLPDDLDCRSFPVEDFATPQRISDEQIDAGDDLYFVGLFTRHVGENFNVPIVRVGNIAAMPEEKIDTKVGRIHAHLVEARSIGGLSGSPAFVHLGPARTIGETHMVETASHGHYYLLGLIHGHFDDPNFGGPPVEDSAGGKMNWGIAVAIPAQKIIDILESDGLVAARQKMLDDFRIQNSTTLD